VARTWWRWVPAHLMVEFPDLDERASAVHEHFIRLGGQWTAGVCHAHSWQRPIGLLGVGRPEVVSGWDRGAGREHSRARGPGQEAGLVLLTLAAGQFLMTLDSSVMNVSIATVARDVGTTVTGIQTAITLYTLVMAMFMVTGGKVGSIIGRRRAFAIGCVIYGAGSLTTALAPNLAILVLGWSLLEGIGAALIMPVIVALVAGIAQTICHHDSAMRRPPSSLDALPRNQKRPPSGCAQKS
jgi:hypothetical protein